MGIEDINATCDETHMLVLDDVTNACINMVFLPSIHGCGTLVHHFICLYTESGSHVIKASQLSKSDLDTHISVIQLYFNTIW